MPDSPEVVFPWDKLQVTLAFSSLHNANLEKNLGKCNEKDTIYSLNFTRYTMFFFYLSICIEILAWACILQSGSSYRGWSYPQGHRKSPSQVPSSPTKTNLIPPGLVDDPNDLCSTSLTRSLLTASCSPSNTSWYVLSCGRISSDCTGERLEKEDNSVIPAGYLWLVTREGFPAPEGGVWAHAHTPPSGAGNQATPTMGIITPSSRHFWSVGPHTEV